MGENLRLCICRVFIDKQRSFRRFLIFKLKYGEVVNSCKQAYNFLYYNIQAEICQITP